LHVCIDDASRLAYSEILPDEKKESAVGFLGRALAWLGSQGISVERVMTDNGSAYRSKAFRAAVTATGAKHKRTRPYTPHNGKWFDQRDRCFVRPAPDDDRRSGPWQGSPKGDRRKPARSVLAAVRSGGHTRSRRDRMPYARKNVPGNDS
jgi:hypothetical protein